MEHKTFGNMICPCGRALEKVGEWWSMLVIRDAYYGMTRFDEFQKSLSIAPNTLAKRLKALVEAGVLERRRYMDKPVRYEYLLTAVGRDFIPVLWALMDWSTKNFAPEGAAAVELVDTRTGEVVKPLMVDGNTGLPIDLEHYRPAPGPAATAAIRTRLSFAREKMSDPEWKPRFLPDIESATS